MLTHSPVSEPDPAATSASSTDIQCATWADVEACLARGWAVFPLWGVVPDPSGMSETGWICSCGDGADCHDAGKHPAWSGGHNSAVTADNAGQLKSWWDRGHGVWNIGVRTGLASELVVIDVDPRNGGSDSLENWERLTGLAMGDGAVVLTGGGGRHEFYRWPAPYLEDPVAIGGTLGVLPGIDIKCDGGYVVGPGSRHVSGKLYRWVSKSNEVPVATLELMQWVREARGSGGGGKGERPAGYDFAYCIANGAPEGMRDAFFNDLIYRLRLAGLPWDKMMTRVKDEYDRAVPGFPWDRVIYQANRVYAITDEELGRRNARNGYHNGEYNEPITGEQMQILKQLIANSRGKNTEDNAPDQEESTHPNAEAVEDTTDDNTTVVINIEDIPVPVTEESEGHSAYIRQLAAEEPTDTGNAERFYRLLAGRVFYITEQKAQEWYVWDDKDGYWKRVTQDHITGLTLMVLDELNLLAKECKAIGNTELGDSWRKWAMTSANMSRRDAMVKGLRTDIRIQRRVSDLNPTASDWLLPLPGGKTIDIDPRTGEWTLRESRREDMLTRVAGVHAKHVEAAIQAGAATGSGGALGEHMHHMTRGDQDQITWLRQYGAVTMTGTTQYATSAWLFGEGANGKNVLISNWWGGMLGSFYAVAQSTLLTSSGENGHPVEMMTVRDARLVFVDEIENKMINSSRFKSVVGEGKIRTRGMGTDWIEFKSTAKLWIASNGRPVVKDLSYGFWRRVRAIELAGVVGENGWVRRPDAWNITPEDLAVGLVWTLAALKDVITAGEIKDTKSIADSTAAYRKREDIIGEWVEDCLVVVLDETTGRVKEDVYVVRDQLATSYQAWMSRNHSSLKQLSLNKVCEYITKLWGGQGVVGVRRRVGDVGPDGLRKQVRVVVGVRFV